MQDYRPSALSTSPSPLMDARLLRYHCTAAEAMIHTLIVLRALSRCYFLAYTDLPAEIRDQLSEAEFKRVLVRLRHKGLILALPRQLTALTARRRYIYLPALDLQLLHHLLGSVLREPARCSELMEQARALQKQYRRRRASVASLRSRNLTDGCGAY